MPKASFESTAASVKRYPSGPMLLAGFTATLFLSAFLLFSVQPVVARMVLPRLGGSPAVWNTCVCFFQAALVLGYAYAHVIAGKLRPRAQVTLHVLVLAAALAALPLSLGADAPSPDVSPVGWLLARLALAVGAPFVALAATAPLLQHWFSRTTHPHAADPYFLYAASNAGSLLALSSYPVLIETTLDLSAQAAAWSVGFFFTAAMVLACGLLARRAEAPAPVASTSSALPMSPGAEWLHWIVLSFVPSALLLAVTTHITTDIAATPLFWVVPLALYLATFILAFAQKQLVGRRTLLMLQAIALAASPLTVVTSIPIAVSLVAALGVFTSTALVCHTELAARRPDTRQLTAYFLLISVGGALGGVFSALLAPVLFPGPWEYPLLLVAACLLRPPHQALLGPTWERRARRSLIVIGAALLALAWWVSAVRPEALEVVALVAAVVLLGPALLLFSGRRLLFATGMACIIVIPAASQLAVSPLMTRSFFGVYRVRDLPDQGIIQLVHGTTIHGVQGTRPGEMLTPFSYYSEVGPFGRAFAALRRHAVSTSAIGLVGLGTGQLACYARPGESWTFHEIDPVVERIARDTRWFQFLSRCGNDPKVRLGDARLSLSADPAVRYDLLIIDAFSSDAIPVHLLTREALALYLARLAPGGMILFHVSNRYLDLVPVVTRLAAEAGAPVRHLKTPPGADAFRQAASEIVAVGSPGGELDVLAADGWDVPRPGPVLWTDERTDILGVIRWR